MNLTRSTRFNEHARDYCADEMRRPDVIEHCGADMNREGYLLACLLEVQQNITVESR